MDGLIDLKEKNSALPPGFEVLANKKTALMEDYTDGSDYIENAASKLRGNDVGNSVAGYVDRSIDTTFQVGPLGSWSTIDLVINGEVLAYPLGGENTEKFLGDVADITGDIATILEIAEYLINLINAALSARLSWNDALKALINAFLARILEVIDQYLNMGIYLTRIKAGGGGPSSKAYQDPGIASWLKEAGKALDNKEDRGRPNFGQSHNTAAILVVFNSTYDEVAYAKFKKSLDKLMSLFSGFDLIGSLTDFLNPEAAVLDLTYVKEKTERTFPKTEVDRVRDIISKYGVKFTASEILLFVKDSTSSSRSDSVPSGITELDFDYSADDGVIVESLMDSSQDFVSGIDLAIGAPVDKSLWMRPSEGNRFTKSRIDEVSRMWESFVKDPKEAFLYLNSKRTAPYLIPFAKHVVSLFSDSKPLVSVEIGFDMKGFYKPNTLMLMRYKQVEISPVLEACFIFDRESFESGSAYRLIDTGNVLVNNTGTIYKAMDQLFGDKNVAPKDIPSLEIGSTYVYKIVELSPSSIEQNSASSGIGEAVKSLGFFTPAITLTKNQVDEIQKNLFDLVLDQSTTSDEILVPVGTSPFRMTVKSLIAKEMAEITIEGCLPQEFASKPIQHIMNAAGFLQSYNKPASSRWSSYNTRSLLGPPIVKSIDSFYGLIAALIDKLDNKEFSISSETVSLRKIIDEIRELEQIIIAIKELIGLIRSLKIELGASALIITPENNGIKDPITGKPVRGNKFIKESIKRTKLTEKMVQMEALRRLQKGETDGFIIMTGWPALDDKDSAKEFFGKSFSRVGNLGPTFTTSPFISKSGKLDMGEMIGPYQSAPPRFKNKTLEKKWQDSMRESESKNAAMALSVINFIGSLLGAGNLGDDIREAANAPQDAINSAIRVTRDSIGEAAGAALEVASEPLSYLASALTADSVKEEGRITP